MKWTTLGRVALLATILALVSVGVIMAQDGDFNDGRINEGFYLGGLALYCNDPDGGLALNYDEGGISIWGAGGTQYLFVTGEELNGAENATTAQTDSTVVEVPNLQQNTLLATGTGQFGPLAFYRLNDDQFQLLFNDQHGKQFSFNWTGCDAEGATLQEFFGRIPTTSRNLFNATAQPTAESTVSETEEPATSAATATSIPPTQQG